MKALKLSFDLSDYPKLVELLRVEGARSGKGQKGILVEALEGYFSNHVETRWLLSAADKAFAEWDNTADSVYDDL